MDQPLAEGAWPIISASPIPYYPHSQVPREMTRADMDRVIADFVQAAERGNRAGFDMLELHCAHGYLLASFISPLTNQRTDDYGGSLENRLRFPLEVFRAHAQGRGRTRSRCRCASRRPTGRRAASPATMRSRSRAPLRKPAAT